MKQECSKGLRLAILLPGIALALGCQSTPTLPPYAGPPSLQLSPSQTVAQTLSRIPTSFKMRHQVEATLGERREVIEGLLVFEAPDKFLVRALSPLGATLFDIKKESGLPLQVDIRLEQLQRDGLPSYLAEDITRIFTDLCPQEIQATVDEQGLVQACILSRQGPNGAPLYLRTVYGLGGVILEKCYREGELQSSCIQYRDYQRDGELWVSHLILLKHRTLPYSLKLVLLEADLQFDTSRIFDSKEGT